MQPVKTIEMTRTEFEEEFGIMIPGDATGVTMGSLGAFLHVKFVGLRQFEIQELEKLYKLQGER
jgi:hypothetical protein